MLILHLAIAIAIILVCIIVLKLNASIGMVLACLYMGGMGGLGLMDTVSTISSGFGNMMTGIGLPIGFGVILGQLLNDSGAAGVIADKIVSAFPEKRAMWAISLAGFVLSIPVFFDVTFVILIPIGITIAAKINKKMCYVTGCLTIGATTAHCVVPPTPNPLAAADIFGFDLGVMMGVGLVVGLITVLLSDFVFIKIHDRGIWNEEKDVNHSSNVVTELLESAKRDAAADRPRPSFAMSLLPIVIPIVCILAGTVGTALFEESPVICRFLGEKVIAMLLGTLGAYLVSIRFIGRENFEKSAGEALKSAGVVLLITGAGGSFSSVIAATSSERCILPCSSAASASFFSACSACALRPPSFMAAPRASSCKAPISASAPSTCACNSSLPTVLACSVASSVRASVISFSMSSISSPSSRTRCAAADFCSRATGSCFSLSSHCRATAISLCRRV